LVTTAINSEVAKLVVRVLRTIPKNLKGIYLNTVKQTGPHIELHREFLKLQKFSKTLKVVMTTTTNISVKLNFAEHHQKTAAKSLWKKEIVNGLRGKTVGT